MKKLILTLNFLLSFVVVSTAVARIYYNYSFNPEQGIVHPEEKAFRQEISLNGKWLFMPVYQAKASDFVLPVDFKWEETPIKIPSPWNVNHFTDGTGGDFVTFPSYPKKWEEAQMGWMMKKIVVPAEWEGKRLILHFKGVLGKTQVFVNRQLAAENFELFLPFEADVTDLLKPGRENEILVGVAKGSLFNDKGKYGSRTYVGGSMWGIEMAGIWQDVSLLAYPQVYLSDLFVQPDLKTNRLKIEIEITNTVDSKQTVSIGGEVRKWYNTAGRTVQEMPVQKGELAKKSSLSFDEKKKIDLAPHSVTRVNIESLVTPGSLEYWTPESPNLYGAVVHIKSGKQIIDEKYDRFGWRQFSVSGNKFLLNGKPVSLKGDSWHFMGVPQMTRRYAWAWFNMLKDANANSVRLHAEPFPEFYLDVADEMGICVLDETGIWSSDGGPKIDSELYWKSCEDHLRRLIKRDKNHACVFGWSVCNETVPVAVNVFKAPEELVQRQLSEINKWVRIVRETDPTREWISGDGETDRPTDLPVIVGHYGGMDGMKRWSMQGKPWGIGEQSMAYYGTPKQVSQYNGSRAYESMQGRMEGIALECYNLIKTQRENNASYSSVFNLAWYALKPLELGLKDTSRPSTADDGIFFGFEEGAYGMQPERLGPYTTTLNPGYDENLPLYSPWPMFDAVKCANATPITPFSIDYPKAEKQEFQASPVDRIVLCAGEKSRLKDDLENLGLSIGPVSGLSGKSLLVIDGNSVTYGDKKQADVVKKAIDCGAKIWVMNLGPESLPFLNQFLYYPLALGERKATSFLKQKDASLLQGVDHGDFYFSELIPRGGTALHYGMTGDFLSKADVLLSACNTDWQCWNYRSETSKTGYVFRSEREMKGPDAVIVSSRLGKSELYLSTLDLSGVKLETQSLLGKMFSNLGAAISNNNLSGMKAFDANGKLIRALLWGPAGREKETVASLLQNEIIRGEATLNPQLNMTTDDRSWNVAGSDDNSQFQFSKSRTSGNKVLYMSFWVFSPRSLVNLLAEPDMPSLDMYIGTEGGFRIWLNSKSFVSKETTSGERETKVPNLLLEKGWNHILVKFIGNDQKGNLKTSLRLVSADQNFMKQILSSVVR